MKRKINILRGVAIVMLVIFSFFTFVLDSLLETGSPIFENNGRLKLSCICLILFVIYFTYLLYKKIKLKNLDIQYVREIPNYYSVPVVSFLYNKRIDLQSLLMATILKFYDLNLITILKQENKIEYKVNSLENIDKISESEKYILDWLLDCKKEKYSFKQLFSVITNELYSNELIKEKSFKYLIFFILTLAIFPILQILGYIPFDSYKYATDFFLSFLFLIIIISIFKPSINKDYSKKGIKEHYNVLGFYNFLKDFSMLSKRKMEEHILWKEYLQFAVLFGINRNYILKDELNILTLDELLNCFERLGENIEKNR